MKANLRSIETKVIHSGEPRPRISGAVVMPVFQSATYQYAGEKSYDDVRYIRLNNTPNHLALAEKLAALENAEDAVVTASGMAAISTSLLTFLGKGNHLLAQDCLYGGTHDFVTRDIKEFGISYDFIDGNKPESWKRNLKPTTKVIYVETISNPLMQVPDLEAVVSFAKSHGLISMIDNTFASPVNFRPLEMGFDLSLHSATKYLNGHSDIVAGAVIGKSNLIEKVTHKLNHLGGSLDPHAAFLLHRGIKTLALRVKQHNESALQIAQFLEKHGDVARVNYPGLESHPNHERAKRLFDGFGGMVSFELHDGVEGAESFMRAARLPAVAPSLGGVETLVTRPSLTSHSGLSPEDRRRLGISDGLIRLSVGIEATQDLIEDFEQALEGDAKRTPSHRSQATVPVHR
ncbi:MAG TPA: aminotransferase class I/II-fold pyridoxal phosphate-dependent enzyme [Dongiaceae bacterium]|nr:aminotransferase class I/II-fold pyridoxal phosphate-dependent enzyme [Dongiaceae bacterium]